MGCNDYRDLIVEALYDELDEVRARQFESHLEQCPDCTELVGEMRKTVALMSRRKRRDPGQAYWDGYWNRLQARMEDEAESLGMSDVAWWRVKILGGASPRVSWAYRAVAAAAILTVGIFVGRMIPMGTEQLTTTPPQVATEPVADTASPQDVIDRPVDSGGGMTVAAASSDDRAMRYVEKSQMLLLALVNTDPEGDGYAADIEGHRRRSRELIGEAGEIKDELDDPKQRRLRQLVGQLEMILREIANLEAEDDLESVDLIRNRVNRHDIMLKINLEQMRYGTDEDGLRSGTPDATQKSEETRSI